MAIIYSYPKLSTLQNKDLLLISDVSSKSKPTMRVELGTLASYITTSTGSITGGGTVDFIPKFSPTSTELEDSIMREDTNSGSLLVDGSFEIFEDLEVRQKVRVGESLAVDYPVGFPNVSQSHLAAFFAFQVNKPTPGSTDTRRQGVVHIGRGSSGNFTEFDHTLNLYTPSDFSDPTNFSDAKAFQYEWNDSYTFIRLQAEDYGAGNVAPLWEIGDFGETTNARWKVNSGDYAKYSDGVVDFFSVTPFLSKFKVPLELGDALIDSLGQPGSSNQVLSSTGTTTRWRDVSSITTILVPHFQTATPGGSATYTQSNNIVDFDWSGGSGVYEYILPSATAIPYRKIRFVNNNTVTASNKIHITAPVGETIDGGAFYEINKAYNGCAVWSDGTEWIVIQAKA